MLHFRITPYHSVGIVNFDDDRETVRLKMNIPYDAYTIPLTKTFTIEQDFFPGIRAKAFYNSENCLEAIEFFRPNVFYKDKNLIKHSYESLLDFFQSEDSNLQVEEDCFTSVLLGIRIGAKDGNMKARIESVLLFDREYLNKKMPTIEEMMNEFLSDYNPEDYENL